MLRNRSLVNLGESARPGPALTSRRCSFRALFAGAPSSLGRFLASPLRAQEGRGVAGIASISRSPPAIGRVALIEGADQ